MTIETKNRQSLDDLARAVNLRDLGGHRGHGGREIRRGVLYRSAALWELSPAQRETMRALGIKSIVDLRFNSERTVHPTPWQELGCVKYWAHDYQPSASDGGLDRLLADEKMTTQSAHDMMLRAYRDLPFHITAGIRSVFETIETGNGPFLFHCTSGKDRTGISAALLLSVLGVPEEAIVTDYLASLQFDVLASPAFKRDKPYSAARLEILKPIYSVHEDYLKATFDTVTAREGSIENFLRGTIGLSQKTLDDIRARLLI